MSFINHFERMEGRIILSEKGRWIEERKNKGMRERGRRIEGEHEEMKRSSLIQSVSSLLFWVAMNIHDNSRDDDTLHTSKSQLFLLLSFSRFISLSFTRLIFFLFFPILPVFFHWSCIHSFSIPSFSPFFRFLLFVYTSSQFLWQNVKEWKRDRKRARKKERTCE